jgi:hypothetical protein
MTPLLKVSTFAMAAAVMAFTATPSMANVNNSGALEVCGKVKTTKCLKTQTRASANGSQYRTPGGNWKNCQGDCATQLRRDKIDFWFYQGG